MQEDELFEYDSKKAADNLKKHKLSFEQAKAIWDDSRYFRMLACSEPEPRWIVTGRTVYGYLSALVTYRGEDGEIVRIISARTASKQEIERYHHE